jgi:tellurite resistance protein TehA-like permease
MDHREAATRSSAQAPAPPAGPLDRWIDRQIRHLYPGYFALVMATGIISNAFFFLGHGALSLFLLGVNLIAFPLLLAATLLRVLRFGSVLWADLVNPRLVFSFFTVVAGADVLGIQLLLRDWNGPAIALWLFALALWAFLSYFSFGVLTFVNARGGADVIHGGWLIAIVGTQSLVLLGAQLAPHFGALAPLAFVTVHTLWGVGIVFYFIFITLFSYRLFFLHLEPLDMTPLFWVVMGAAAISTNAGSTLILSKPILPFLVALRPFVDGMTLIMWAWSTWWIPLLLMFDLWKYGVHRQPLVYHPMFWSMVFPLGMYAVATYRFSLAADFSLLQVVARGMIWIAFGVWTAIMLGLLGGLWKSVRQQPSAES